MGAELRRLNAGFAWRAAFHNVKNKAALRFHAQGGRYGTGVEKRPL